jgi:predicted ATPase
MSAPKSEIEFETQFIGREKEIAFLKKVFEDASAGNGTTIFIAGEAGVGKSRLLQEFKNYVQSKGGKCLIGTTTVTPDPYQLFSTALSELSEEPLFEIEDYVKIDEVFAVTNTGILLAHYTAGEVSDVDEYILSGMLTAVQDFVKDSLGDVKAIGGLGKLEYEDTKILIEHGDRLFIAGVIRGDEHPDMRKHIKTVVEEIEKDYKNVLVDWDGDLAKVKGLRRYLTTLTSRRYPIRRALEEIRVDVEQIRRFEYITNLLVSEASQQPVVVLLEDLHWCDETSLHLLEYIARNLKNTNLLICATYRPEELTGVRKQLIDKMYDEDICRKIDLRPLDMDDTTKIAELVLSIKALPKVFSDTLYTNSRGNPFYIKEFIQTLCEENIIVKDDGGWKFAVEFADVKVPVKIKDLISRRLEKLGEDELRAVEYAATIGRPFTPEVIGRCLEIDPNTVNTIFEKLHASKFLVPAEEDRYQFDHDIIRTMVYEGLSERWRKLTHKKVGYVLEDLYKLNIDEVVYQLAEHFTIAEEYQKAVGYCVMAGDKANNTFAVKDAIKFYSLATKIYDKLGETRENTERKVELLEKIGDINALIGTYDDALDTYRKAQHTALTDVIIARLYRKAGMVLEKRGEYEKALATLSEGLNVLGVKKDVEIGRINLYKGSVCWRKGDYEKAMQFCNTVLRVFEEYGCDEKDWAQVYHTMGNIYYSQREYERALESHEKSLEIREKLSDLEGMAMSYNNIGLIHKSRGSYETALEYHKKSLEIREKIGDQQGVAMCYNNIGLIYYSKGDWQDALKAYEKSLSIREKIDDKKGIATIYHNMSVIYDDMGEYDKALEYSEKAFQIREKIRRQESLLGLEITT